MFTALLVFVVLTTTGRRFAPGFGGLTAGITLAVIHLVTIPVDNTGVNPARSLATAIFADTSPSALGQLWAFILFPLIGSVVGVFVWLHGRRGDAGVDDARRRRAASRRATRSTTPSTTSSTERVTRSARRRRQTGVTSAMATADDVETYRRHSAELVRYATVLVGPAMQPTSSPTPSSPRSRRRRGADVANRRAYLYRAVLHHSMSFHRSSSRRRRREQVVVARDRPAAEPEPSSIDAHRALAALSEQQRAVTYLTYWEDLPPDRIAELLGVAEGTVRKQLARARDHLRRILDA